MNQVVYEQLRLGSRKSSFMFVYLTNKPSSILSLGSTIKQAEFKHNNVLVKKLVNMKLNLSI